MGSQILLKGSQMSPLWTLGIAVLVFGFTACEPAEEPNAASNNSCYRKECNGTQYAIQEDTYCGSKLHRGAGLSCCGNEAYNPETATCCKVQHGSIPTVSVTQGLSEKVSKCCDLKAYNPVNEICCKSTIFAKPEPMAECCGEEVFDKDKQLCCGSYDNKMLLVRNSSHYQCCGHDQYDTKTQCCCLINEEVLQIDFKESDCCVKDSTAAHLCGNEPYDQHTQLCCQSTVVDKPSPTHECCDKRVHDVENQLCCGPFDDKKILTRNSRDHQCCRYSQFNTKTECCCWKNDTAEIQPRNSSCCDSATFEGGQHQASVTFPKTSRGSGEAATLELHPICTEPDTHLCGSSCYNPKERRCCERNQKPNWFCTSGQSWTTPTVYDPSTQVCCDGCVSVWKPWIDQCCGETPYGLAQRGVLCCNNTLYKGREDGEECSEMGIPYNPDKGTMCCSQFHGSAGEHCCGTEIYHPRAEICCNGHRHPKSENIHCCGVKAYSIKDPQMKCCAGVLYNLTSLEKHGGDTQCCGSILQRPQEICCSSQDKEVLYSEKTDFRCCGHLYYNTSLWSCCAGRLRSIHEPGQDQRKMINGSRLLSVNNLNETYLCKEMHIGIVESVSPRGIVFRSVLKIHGKELVKALPLPHILETADHCSSPKLIPGKTYFFNELNVFTDFNHDSVLQSLHFIISKCSR